MASREAEPSSKHPLRRPHLALFLLAALATGCGPAVAGKWESKNDAVPCGEPITFEVFDDLTGEGEACACDFTVSFEERGSNDWRVEVDYEGGLDCLFANRGTYDCDLSDDANELDCEEVGQYDRVD